MRCLSIWGILGRFIALTEPVGIYRAQGLGRERLLTKGSAFASDNFGRIALVVHQGLVMPAAADKLVSRVVGETHDHMGLDVGLEPKPPKYPCDMIPKIEKSFKRCYFGPK